MPFDGSFAMGGVETPEPFEVSLQSFLQAALSLVVFPSHVPARYQTYPRMTYQQISGDRDLRLSGPTGLVSLVVQFDAWGKTANDVAVLIEMLRLALNGYTGIMGQAYVQNVTFRDLATGWEPGVNDSDTGTYRKSVECTFTFGETVA